MKNVSFDFDGVLDREDVQDYVKELIGKGFYTWVLTAAYPDEDQPIKEFNKLLWDTCEEIGIPRERVIFTSYKPKYMFLINKDFIFHLDDSEKIVHDINTLTGCKGIDVDLKSWKDEAEEVIKESLDIELKKAVSEVIWMARRYADGRKTYAPSLFNDSYDIIRTILDDLDDPIDKTLMHEGEFFPYAQDGHFDSNKSNGFDATLKRKYKEG